MLKPLLILIAPLFLTTAVNAQTNVSFPLWPDGAPGALGTNDVDVPTLTAYLPDPAKATGAAMVICPGGGYEHLSVHEGYNYADWLNRNGVAGFVLKYRLGRRYHHPAMLQDAARALRIVRASAEKWHLDPHRIGIIGSSAGGHLASTLLTHFDAGNPDAADPVERVSSRPDIGVLCYAVISMDEYVNVGSKVSLLGTNPPPELVWDLSTENRVTPATPPCFLWTTFEDKVVPMENTMFFAEALRRAQVPFDLHVYQKGGHGLGLGTRDLDSSKWHPWVHDCEFWLKAQGFIK